MTINAMTVSAGEAAAVLRAGWQAQAEGRMTLSWMLHGSPGVGKTQVVTRLAREIGARLHDLRLTTIEPQDLRGLPAFDHETRRTVWYRPEDLPDATDRPTILFLDELTAAPPLLQPTVYGLLQERRVGRHELPDQVFVVAAGNMVEDGAVAHEMGMGLSDRMVHLVLRPSAGDWVQNYALRRGLHPAVTAFVRTRPDLLDTTQAALDKGLAIACTPRSWERVSLILQTIPDRRIRDIMIAGTLGEAVAAEFALIADEIAATVQVETMLALPQRDRWPLYPETMHGLAALIHGLAAMLGPDTADPAIETLAGVADLARLRDTPAFGRMPLAELTTHGFELLIARGLDLGLEDRFLENPAFRRWSEAREAQGLA